MGSILYYKERGEMSNQDKNDIDYLCPVCGKFSVWITNRRGCCGAIWAYRPHAEPFLVEVADSDLFERRCRENGVLDKEFNQAPKATEVVLTTTRPQDPGVKGKGKVNPLDYEGQIMWAVYGPKCFTSILCFKLSRCSEDQKIVNIWGYSIDKGHPGFRTLGNPLEEWIRIETGNAGGEAPRFYLSLDKALKRLRKLMTPAVWV